MVNPEWQRLVEENLALARSVAGRFARKGMAKYDPAVDFDDLVAVAYEGLIYAARYFRPELGYRFSTYAVSVIAGHISKIFRRNARGVKVSALLAWSNRPAVTSLDIPVGERGDHSLGDFLLSTGHGEVEETVMARAIISHLPERCQLVLRLRADGWRQQDVANRLGVSQPQASRLERRAWRELRAAIGEWGGHGPWGGTWTGGHGM